MSFLQYYDYVSNEISDHRVKDWFLMSSPIILITIITIYLTAVYVIVPAFMKNRKPYNLKTVIKYYNIIQIISCSVVIYGFVSNAWMTGFHFSCQPADFSNKPTALRMMNVMYLGLNLKMIDFIETTFYILRKKESQVTILHVYHHTIAFTVGWIGLKYGGGSMVTFPVTLNSFIHVIMYTYYLLSSFGPEWQKRLAKWKPRLTMAQLIQFGVVFLQLLISLRPSCDLKVSKKMYLIYIPNLFAIIYGFWDFYKKTYQNKIKKSE